MSHDKYPTDVLLAGLRAAAAAQGEPLTFKGYDAYRAGADEELASAIWIVRKFGSWNSACERAGVKCNSTRSTSRKWSEAQLVEHVADYLQTPGVSGSYAGYDAWSRTVDGAPSGATLRATFPWAEAKALAADVVAERAG